MATDETGSPYGLSKFDADFLKTFHSTIKELRGLVISNVEFYQRGTSGIYARYYTASCILFERLQSLEPQVLDIVPRLCEFDFSAEVPGNGYRSFITIVNRCILYLLQLCRHINVNKNNLLFRSTYYLKELEAYVETIGQLIACLGYLKQLISLTKNGELFYNEENEEGDEILLEVEMLNTDCFYGRCLGFQFSESMQKLLQVVLVAMATFSECYEESSQVILLASSLLNSSKYIVDQDMRAKQVVNVTRTADIKFCKAFWSIPESPVLTHLRSFTYPHVEVNSVITLQPDNFELPLEGSDNETVTITPPCAHSGPAAVSVRLISHVLREGMQVDSKRSKKTSSPKSLQPKSKGLLFHCHGGGFVAQSSQSHENYLRVWARQLKMPILSVDYSLAPESPFPRALEESFYAYAWALKNPQLLGWTGELVCFAGDSAGGNLVVSTALRAISYGIRVPDGIMAAYPALLVQYTPSPARLMSMIDPLLPVGILTRCLAAYAGIADKFSSALAKPIFCNPGKYETWEVIDPRDVTTDSVGAQIKKQIPADTRSEIQVSNQTDNHVVDVKSLDSILSRENSESCYSIEDIDDIDDDFVVCDTEELLQDSLHYKGTVIGGGGSDCDNCDNIDFKTQGDCDMRDGTSVEGNRSELNSDIGSKDDLNRTDLNTDVDVRNSLDSPKDVHDIEKTETDLTTNISPVKNLDIQKENSSVSNVTQGQDSKGDVHGMEKTDPTISPGKNLDNQKESNSVSNVTQGQDSSRIDTIAGALAILDSNVVITIDDICDDGVDRAETNKDLADGYAVCQDIICERDSRYIASLDRKGRNFSFLQEAEVTSLSIANDRLIVDGMSDMDGTSCHSLEDLTDRSLYSDDGRTDEQTQEGACYSNKLSVQSDGQHGAKEKLNINTDRENKNGLVPKRSRSDPNFEPIRDVVDGQSDISVEQKEAHAHNDPSNNENPTNNEKLHRRAMSLDFPPCYHGNSSGSKSPAPPVSRTPLSPRLPKGSRTFSPKRYSIQRKITQSPIKLFRQLPIVKNFYMSPMLAPDDLLLGLPNVYLTACHFDPLLDDSVMFAKKLSNLGKFVDLQIMDYLPHGFLSFSDTSIEAKKASSVCLEKIMKVLKCDPP